jgi:thioredoxin 1
MSVKEVTTKEEFEKEVKQAKGTVVVDFWAPWCGPCKMMAPALEEVANQSDSVSVVKANIDEDDIGEIAGDYGIMSIPTLIGFRDGEVSEQRSGALGKEEIKEFIQSLDSTSEE